MPKDRTDSGTACVVGVAGPSDSGLAQALTQQGMRLPKPPGAARVAGSTRLVIHGPEVGRTHSARLGALRRGIRQQTPLDWLRGAMAGRRGVVVLGKHVATSAAAMIGLMLDRAGDDPCVLLNAPARQLGGWSRHGAGPFFVTTWDHPLETLAEVGPELLVVLDPDGEMGSGVLERVRIAASEGVVIADDSRRATTGEALSNGIEWLSLEEGGDWSAPGPCADSRRFPFRVFHRGRYVIETQPADLRRGRALSMLAAVAVCARLGVSGSVILEGVEAFSGVDRDFQRRGSFRGVSLIDDHAETASAIAETLAHTRTLFGARRLWVVMAESCLTRSKADPDRLAAVLAKADRVSVVIGGSTGASWGNFWTGRLDETIADLDRRLEPGDVLLTLGPGEVGTIADAFIRRLPRDRQGG